MKERNYLKGAFIISAGGFVSKLLGAVYRIPLIAFLGGKGMGIYQMVYPLYCILLTISSSGIPTGVARIISSRQCPFAERPAMRIYGVAGLLGSLLMFALASPLSAAQGEPSVAICCKLLAPSVFFVSIISVVRGYFQGRGNMLPTAATEIAEQSVKIVFGLVLCRLFRDDVAVSVSAAVLAVTISEAFSAVYAGILYLRSPRSATPLYYRPSEYYGIILRYTIPLTFTAMALPLSQLAESIFVVALLRRSCADATALWGVFSGCALTLINLPASLTYGLAAAGVPQISPLAQRGDIPAAKSRIWRAMLLTAAISVLCAVALFAFSPIAVALIFGSLSMGEQTLLVHLVRLMSVNAVTISLMQTSSAFITSLGRPVFGTFAQWSTCILRVSLSCLLVSFGRMSIVGAAISSNICYLVAVLLNVWYICSIRGNKNENHSHRIGNNRRRSDAVG